MGSTTPIDETTTMPSASCPRLLALETALHLGGIKVPSRSDHWTRAELDDLRQDLVRRRLWTEKAEGWWTRMLSSREQTLESMVRYRQSIPAPVLAETLLAWRRYRACHQQPRLAGIAHRLSQVLAKCSDPSIRGSKTAGQRLKKLLGDWQLGTASSLYLFWGDGLGLPGGLRLHIHGNRFRLELGGALVLDAPANDSQIPRLQRGLVLWSAYVRRSTANALVHAADANPMRSVDSGISLALPVASTDDQHGLTLLEERLVQRRWIHVLPTNRSQGHARRLATAKVLLKAGEGHFKDEIREAIALEIGSHTHRPFQSLDVALPSDNDVQSQLDGEARRLIRPLCNGTPVQWGEPADAWEVLTDDFIGPKHLLTLRSLPSAIAVEAANRSSITGHLGLAVA